MRLIIEAGYMLLWAPKVILDAVHSRYAWHDTGIEYQLGRLISRGIWLKQTGNWQYKHASEEMFLAEQAAREAELTAKLDGYCTEFIDNELRIPIGLYEDLAAYLSMQSMPLEVQDRRNFALPRREMPGYCPKLRAPQTDALRIALQKPVGTIRMATGVGKTVVGQEIIRHLGHPALFLVPTKPILLQTVDRFKSAFGSRHVGRYGGGKKKLSHVTVATYQSVYNADPEDFLDYDTVIADECHHVPADTFYEVVENRLKNAVYRYGLTADEERTDGVTVLVEAATGPVVFAYDAPQAIQEGYLAQPTFIVYEITRTEGTYIKWKIDKSGKRVQERIVQSEANDKDDAQIAYKNWILGNDLLNREVAALAQGFSSQGSSVLILIDEREHGDKLMQYLQKFGAVLVTGETEGNELVQARFNRRELKLVVATSTWGEGSDTPPVDVLMNLMGGNKTKQANGRALRNDPDENGIPRKPTCLIIDFDVPRSATLHRQCETRIKVHETCGPVHRRTLV